MPPKLLDQLVFPIPGSCTLKDIRMVIRFQEASLWQLKELAVDGRLNKATFVPVDNVPKDLEFTADGAPQPEGTTQIWRGKLRYNGAEQTVILYRTN